MHRTGEKAACFLYYPTIPQYAYLLQFVPASIPLIEDELVFGRSSSNSRSLYLPPPPPHPPPGPNIPLSIFSALSSPPAPSGRAKQLIFISLSFSFPGPPPSVSPTHQMERRELASSSFIGKRRVERMKGIPLPASFAPKRKGLPSHHHHQRRRLCAHAAQARLSPLSTPKRNPPPSPRWPCSPPPPLQTLFRRALGLFLPLRP